MKRIALILLLLATPLFAATSRNDDSCDIGLFPAATLLLPYFEVDIASPEGSGETTIFTVTNTSPLPQAARVTLWTDFAYPVTSFNIFLTGYDVQSVNLYNVIVKGLIEETGSDVSPRGPTSSADNNRLNEASCTDIPAQLPAAFRERMKSALTLGKAPAIGEGEACNTAGGVHTNAIGYATIDVVGVCSATRPIDAVYFTHEIRFDNVLMGDYIQVNGAEDFAQANPMVHIRAIPEGGEVSTRRKTNMPRTFYSRLQSGGTLGADGRQPLPAKFGARWISGGANGFDTFYKIWRESKATSQAVCSAYPAGTHQSFAPVRFDEEENPETISPHTGTPPGDVTPRTLATSLSRVDDESRFPPNTHEAVGGWMYLNLDDGRDDTIASQNWVVASMRVEDRFSVDIEATQLGNGCTPAETGIEELAARGN